MNDLRLKLPDQAAEGGELGNPGGRPGKAIQRDAEIPKPHQVGVRLAIIPDHHGRPIPRAVHRPEKVAELLLESALNQPTHDVKQSTAHLCPSQQSEMRLLDPGR